MEKNSVVNTIYEIVEPIAAEMGLEIWDIRYEKEGGSWYLRVFIDKDGGVNIDDCENLSRAIDAPIDEADPIDHSYFLEVSSPGIERELIKPEHFEKFAGVCVTVKTIRPIDGQREFVGILNGLEDGIISIETEDGELKIEKKQTAYVRVYDDDIGGDF